MLGRHAALEGNAIRLRGDGAVGVLGEEQPLLLADRGLEVACPADEAGLALLADATAEHRLDEDLPVPVEEPLDLVLARAWTQHLGHRKADMPEQRRAIEQP